jgi:mono/diheme cytochrome c family protein
MKSTTRISRMGAVVVFAAVTGTGALLFARATASQHPSATFLEYCAKCHGEDGKGQTPKGKQLMARDFTDAEWQSAKSDADLVKTVTKGGEDMPSFGKKLSQEQIEALVKEDVRGFGKKK